MTRRTPAPDPSRSATGPRDSSEADAQGMDLLAAHVPLTLLFDLAPGTGPGSRAILSDEQPSADELAWLAPTS